MFTSLLQIQCILKITLMYSTFTFVMLSKELRVKSATYSSKQFEIDAENMHSAITLFYKEATS